MGTYTHSKIRRSGVCIPGPRPEKVKDRPVVKESDPKRVRGGVLLAKALAEKQIERVFTLSGGFINPVLEGLMDSGISVVNSPHEQVAGNMADAWTRLTRKPAVCLVGPEGFANAVAAMAEAYLERSPVIFITASSTMKRLDQGGFKELDHTRIAEPMTKYSALVTAGERIPEFIDKAYDIAVNGNPGPVHLSIPVDMIYSSYEENPDTGERPFKLSSSKVHRPEPAAADMRELVETLESAEKPVIVTGHGVWWAGAETALERVATALGIPVYNMPYHMKMLDPQSPVYLGMVDIHLNPPSKVALEEADTIVVIGCRLDNMLNFGNPPLFPQSATLVSINGSEAELADNHVADLRILGHPEAVLTALHRMATAEGLDFEPGWLEANRTRRQEWAAEMNEKIAIDQGELYHPLRLSLDVLGVLGEGDYLVVDGGDTHFWGEVALNMSAAEGGKLRGVLHPGPLSILGVGVPFGVATKMRHPESRVVVLSGDGAFLAGGLSIDAAFANDVPITVVVDNNRGYGSIMQQQKLIFKDGRTFKTGFRDIPFHTMFEALGGYGELVDKPGGLAPALERALASGVPACVNVRSRSVISPLIAGLADRRARASIE